MMRRVVGLIATAHLGLMGTTQCRATAPSPSSRRVELNIPGTPAAMRREGVLCIPVKWLASEFGAQITALDSNRTLVRLYGKSLVITPDSSEVEVNQKPQRLPAVTFVSESHLYIPAQLLKTLWGFEVDCAPGDTCKVSLAPACITGVRYSVAAERVRIVLDLNRPAPFSFENHGATFSVNLPSVTGYSCKDPEDTKPSVIDATVGPRPDAVPRPLPIHDVLVKEVLSRFTGQLGASVQVNLKYRAPVKVFTLDDPFRIVMDCVKIFEETETSPIGTGAELIAMRLGTPAGPVKIHTAKIKLRGEGGGYSLRPVLANKSLSGLSPPSEMAKREGGLVAVNGGYFAGNGSPLGNLVIDGEWIKTSDIVRTGLIVTRSGKVVIDAIQWRGRVKFATGATFTVDALNAHNGNTGNVVVLTPRWGKSVTLSPHEAAVVVARQEVVSVKQSSEEENDEVAIPEEGFVVCARNDSAKRMTALKPGTRCDLEWSAGKDCEEICHVLSAGPRLVKGGAEHITAVEEKFKNDIVIGRAPRTAVGVTSDNDLILFAAEGRHPEESIGLTLAETARLMIKLGAVDALNLDGGSSTTMVVDGKVITAGGAEKRVSDALVIVPG